MENTILDLARAIDGHRDGGSLWHCGQWCWCGAAPIFEDIDVTRHLRHNTAREEGRAAHIVAVISGDAVVLADSVARASCDHGGENKRGDTKALENE